MAALDTADTAHIDSDKGLGVDSGHNVAVHILVARTAVVAIGFAVAEMAQHLGAADFVDSVAEHVSVAPWAELDLVQLVAD